MVPKGLPEPETYGTCSDTSTAHPLMISARNGDDFSFALTTWGEGIRPYDFELPYGYSAPSETFHTVFDRALVRQGITVGERVPIPDHLIPDDAKVEMEAKIAAGCEFVQTQFCMDADVVRRYMARLAEHGGRVPFPNLPRM